MYRVEDRVLVVVVAQVYHEKVKTSGKIWVHDATPVTALDLMLFGGQLQVMRTRQPFTRLFIRLFIRLFNRLFIRLFIRLIMSRWCTRSSWSRWTSGSIYVSRRATPCCSR